VLNFNPLNKISSKNLGKVHMHNEMWHFKSSKSTLNLLFYNLRSDKIPPTSVERKMSPHCRAISESWKLSQVLFYLQNFLLCVMFKFCPIKGGCFNLNSYSRLSYIKVMKSTLTLQPLVSIKSRKDKEMRVYNLMISHFPLTGLRLYNQDWVGINNFEVDHRKIQSIHSEIEQIKKRISQNLLQ